MDDLQTESIDEDFFTTGDGNEDEHDEGSSCNSNVSIELSEITENWRGLGKNQDIQPSINKKRKRITKYMESTP